MKVDLHIKLALKSLAIPHLVVIIITMLPHATHATTGMTAMYDHLLGGQVYLFFLCSTSFMMDQLRSLSISMSLLPRP